MIYNKFMDLALQQAEIALNEASEVPVGCVITTQEGLVLSSAYNMVEKFNTSIMHAEIIALYRATRALRTKYLNKCNIYITLEPCLMCADAIAKHRLLRIYYAASDEVNGIFSKKFSSFDNIFNYNPEIYCGIMQRRSESILEKFFQRIRATT